MHLLSPVTTTAISLTATALLILGLGAPNHPYQLVIALLTIAVSYHRGWLVLASPLWTRALPLINVANLTLLLKMLIGSGVRYPFWWVQLPGVNLRAPDGLSVIPKVDMEWHPTLLSGWSFDFTLAQIFLLILTWLAVLFGLELLSSLGLLALLLLSLPAFTQFQWDWVFPALLTFGVSIYLQHSPAEQPETPAKS